MSDEHIDSLLGSTTPEQEFADEVKAYEAEEAKKLKEEPAPEPEPEIEAEAEADDDEPEVEAASDDEPQVEAEAEPEPEQPKQDDRQVPLKALQAERAKTDELKQRLDRITTYLQAQQQQTQQQEPQEEIPNPDEDPIAAVQYLMKQNQKLAEQQQEALKQQQQQQYLADVQQRYASAAQQYAAEKPDFQEAYSHLLNSRAQELRLGGVPEERINAQIQQEEYGFAIEAMKNNVNPAERIYQMAQVRGYQPKAQANPAPAPRQADPTLEAAKKAAATNTNRSKPAARSLTLDEIAELNGAAFDKAMAKFERENGLAPKSVL